MAAEQRHNTPQESSIGGYETMGGIEWLKVTQRPGSVKQAWSTIYKEHHIQMQKVPHTPVQMTVDGRPFTGCLCADDVEEAAKLVKECIDNGG